MSMQSWNQFWRRWTFRADRVQPTTRTALIWLVGGLISFVFGSFVPSGLALWSGLWFALIAVCIIDLAVLRGWGVPVVTRDVPSRWQLGIRNEVVIVIHAPSDGVFSFRHARALHEMRLDTGAPESFYPWSSSETSARKQHEGAIQFVITFVPKCRGESVFSGVDTSWRSPLGLWRRMHRYDSPDTDSNVVLVLPDLTTWQKEVIALQRTLHDEGRHVKRLTSGSTEFSYITEHTPDDDPRQVNWSATARRSRLMRNVYEPERGQHVMIAIDASRYMGMRLPDGKQRIDYAVECAAALVQTAIAAGDTASVTAFTDKILLQTLPGRGPSHYAGIVQRLAGIEAQPVQGGYEALFGSLVGRFRRRSLLVVISEMEGVVTDVGFFPALASFQLRHPTLFVTVADVQALQRLECLPTTTRKASFAAAAEWVLRDREAAKEQLIKHGVQVIESLPGGLVVDTVREYLRRKRRQPL